MRPKAIFDVIWVASRLAEKQWKDKVSNQTEDAEDDEEDDHVYYTVEEEGAADSSNVPTPRKYRLGIQ